MGTRRGTRRRSRHRRRQAQAQAQVCTNAVTGTGTGTNAGIQLAVTATGTGAATATATQTTRTILFSSSRASLARSRSLESTTKMRPWRGQVFGELALHALQTRAAALSALSALSASKSPAHLRVLEVVAPQRADLVLTSDVPHGKVDVLVLDRLDVKALEGENASGEREARALEMDGTSDNKGTRKVMTRQEGARRQRAPAVPMVGMVVTISPSLSL